MADAKNSVPKPIKAVEADEKPKFGTLKGKIVIHDLDWWKPMIDEEVEDFVEGRR